MTILLSVFWLCGNLCPVFVMTIFLLIFVVYSPLQILSFLEFTESFLTLAPPCPPTPREQLRKILGAAYNARYMSIEKPDDLFTPEFADVGDFAGDWQKLPKDQQQSSTRRSTHVKNAEESFHVAPTYRRLFYADEMLTRRRKRRENVGNLTRASAFPRHKSRRASTSALLPWQCDQHVEWLDLGQDHFPRYLRSVKCTVDRCFYGHYRCRPKAFTVNVLRRISDKCVPLTDEWRKKLATTADDGDHGRGQSSTPDFQTLDGANDGPRFLEPWTFEEIAVNFCCDCVT